MYQFRPAQAKDVPVIVDYRIRMFQSFLGDTFDEPGTRRFEIDYFTGALSDGRVGAFVAEDDTGRVVASAAVSYYEITPKPWNLEGRHAFISSMYTEPDHRRKGIGGRLLQAALDHARDAGVEWVTLHSSESGHSLYESFGFKKTNEMRLRLSTDA